MLSEPERERDVLFEISALSSISITTVKMSPCYIARLSPSKEFRPLLQREA